MDPLLLQQLSWLSLMQSSMNTIINTIGPERILSAT
uniref:Uncharacterized protein n=1 Tax=Setaria viridis TaxID=4556 RepID=A0A4U6TIW8_SETVI|nr:hypothetical protein SEVIR_8G239150v2 [Setaria viridis]